MPQLMTDPNISLGVQVPGLAAGGLAGVNPLSMINTLSELQLRMNQNLLFQQQFQANTMMGQIMSQSQPGPDGSSAIDNGLNQILRSPAAPFAGPFIANMRAADKTMLDMSLAKGTAGAGIVGNYLKSLSAAYADPTMIPNLRAAALATAPKEVAPQAATAIDSLNMSLLNGLEPMVQSGDQRQIAQAGQALRVRTLGLLAPFVPAETLRALSGTVTPGVEQGPYGPGGAHMPFGVGTNVFGAPAVTGLPGGAGPASGASGNALVPALSGANALVPGGPLMGLSKAAEAQAEQSGKAAGTISEDMSNTLKTIPEDVNRINLMQQALGRFQAGGFASARAELAKVLQGFSNAGVNVNPDLINMVGNKSLADTQIFEAFSRPEVINQLKQSAQGTGRVMRSEVDAFLAMMNPTIDPEALRVMLNNAKYGQAVRYDQAQKFARYTGDPLKFYADYTAKADPYSLATRTPGGLDFSPIPPANVKGAPANADLWKGWGEQGVISRTAVERLRKDPSLAPQFEQRFGLGPGGAQQYLGSGQ